MVKCDFHTHSTASDGLYTPSEVVEKAYNKGVRYLALTDHDTLSGIEEAINKSKELGMEFIPGIELSTVHNKESVHVLGFFKGDEYKNKELNDYLADIKVKRIKRAEEIVEKLAKYHDIHITVENILKNGKDTIARPHIAKTIIEAGYPYDKEYIFDNFIGDDCPAYVPANKLETTEGIALLKKYNATVVLAHPVLLKKNRYQDIVALGFDGLEGVYSLNSEDDTKRFLDFVRTNDLITSCGSDSHGYEGDGKHGVLGCVSLEESWFEKFINAVK